VTRPLVVLALAGAVPAAAASSGKTFRASFIGENRATTPATTGAAADCLENCGRVGLGAPIEAAPPSAAAGPRRPEVRAAAPQPRIEGAQPMRRSGGFGPRDPAAQRYEWNARRERLSDSVADRAPRREAPKPKSFALWDSVAAPIEMTSAQVARTGLGDAERLARAEYERRILGRETSFSAPPAALAPRAPTRALPVGDIFVSVDVAGTGPDALKDAVAGLSSAAGFRLDARFPPSASAAARPSAAASASLRGWLPADRVEAAVRAPGVVRVQVDRAAPRLEGTATTSLVVGVRIPEGAGAGESFRRTVGELETAARFQWTRTIGFEAVPNSRDVALVVVGELPLARLPRLLEHPHVMKVAPAPLDPAAAAAAPAPPRSRLSRFLSYAREQAPLLVALTLLLLVPSVGGLLLRVGELFIPYRR
jgi:hypothetical protein